MKRSVILISILLIVSFSISAALAQPEETDSQPAVKTKEPASGEKQVAEQSVSEPSVELNRNLDSNTPTPTESTATDEAAVDDANTVVETETIAEVNIPEEYEKELERLIKNSKRVSREWTRRTITKRTILFKSVYKQNDAELALIRKLAAEEGAAKTTMVIDKLLADKQEQFEETIKKIEEAEEKAKLRERGKTKRTRTREDRNKRTRTR